MWDLPSKHEDLIKKSLKLFHSSKTNNVWLHHLFESRCRKCFTGGVVGIRIKYTDCVNQIKADEKSEFSHCQRLSCGWIKTFRVFVSSLMTFLIVTFVRERSAHERAFNATHNTTHGSIVHIFAAVLNFLDTLPNEITETKCEKMLPQLRRRNRRKTTNKLKMNEPSVAKIHNNNNEMRKFPLFYYHSPSTY